MTQRILGVDPGINATGYGVIEQKNNTPTVVACGTIFPPKKKLLPDRLVFLYDELKNIIRETNPSEVIVEETFFSENAKTALVLGHARGVILLAAAHAELPCFEYSTRKVKMSIVGNGAATKEQVQFMVKRILQYHGSHPSLDTSDALAVALCHLFQKSRAI